MGRGKSARADDTSAMAKTMAGRSRAVVAGSVAFQETASFQLAFRSKNVKAPTMRGTMGTDDWTRIRWLAISYHAWTALSCNG